MKKRTFFLFITLITSNITLSQNIDSGLVAYYPMSGNAADSSGNGHHGLVHGAKLSQDRFGNQNSCYSFDGINDYIDLGSNAADGIRSISLWFNSFENISPNLSDNKTLIYRNNISQGTPGYDEFGLFFSKWTSPKGAIEFVRYKGINTNLRVKTNIHSWEANSWNHVVATIHPVIGMQLYLNGILQSSTNSSTSKIISTNDPTYLGTWGNFMKRYFKGKIDDVRFYDRHLNKSEVDKLHNLISLKKAKDQKIRALIYPNPAFENLHLDFEKPMQNLTVEVIDINGKQKLRIENYKTTVENLQMDISNLANGIYTLRLKTIKSIYIKKFLKQ